MKRKKRICSVAFSVALFLAALSYLVSELRTLSWNDLCLGISQISGANLVTALVVCCASYFVLGLYDELALRYINKAISFATVLRISFYSYAFSHTLGFALITGGSIRARLYKPVGLTLRDVAKIVLFSNGAYALGFLFIGGLLFALRPPHFRGGDEAVIRSAGLAMLVILAGLVCWATVRRSYFRMGRGLRVPSTSLTIAATLVSALDWALACLVLYYLLPETISISFSQLLGIYLLAQTAGLISQVPGGLGVFEGTFLFMTEGMCLPAPLVSALVAYRVVYYLFPFLIAAVGMGKGEWSLFKSLEAVPLAQGGAADQRSA